MQDEIKKIIKYIGDDPNREGLLDTPRRVENAYKELFKGYSYSKEEIKKLVTTFSNEGFDELIVVKDIDYFSTCEHHMIPFFGKVNIGYIPGKKIIGLSKFARITELFARRLQVQERLTKQIADFIDEALNPKGLIVVVSGVHLCMVSRGVKKNNSVTITSDIRGVLRDNSSLARQEFFNLINIKK